jgi:phosphopantothenoylcysteine synthetase/decarboxylase
MNCLVTAGNTQVLIDKVRCITNIFSGRTGAQIALELQKQGTQRYALDQPTGSDC